MIWKSRCRSRSNRTGGQIDLSSCCSRHRRPGPRVCITGCRLGGDRRRRRLWLWRAAGRGEGQRRVAAETGCRSGRPSFRCFPSASSQRSASTDSQSLSSVCSHRTSSSLCARTCSAAAAAAAVPACSLRAEQRRRHCSSLSSRAQSCSLLPPDLTQRKQRHECLIHRLQDLPHLQVGDPVRGHPVHDRHEGVHYRTRER